MPRPFVCCPVDSCHRRRGFTLIEMLLVVAIIVILISMLLPGLSRVKQGGMTTKCESNLKLLITGYLGYERENKRFMGANTGAAWDWLGEANVIASVTNWKLYPYVGSADAYRCPNHIYPSYLNSYSINGYLNGEQKYTNKANNATENDVPPQDLHLYLPKTHITADMNPSKQLVFIEEDDNRGWNINSFMLYKHSNGYVDLVPANHDGGDNIAFLDSHVELRKWADADMRRRPKPWNPGGFGGNAPNDHAWLLPLFRTWGWPS